MNTATTPAASERFLAVVREIFGKASSDELGDMAEAMKNLIDHTRDTEIEMRSIGAWDT
jgi:hypothetical protein